MLDNRVDVGTFRRNGFEEFFPCRLVVKEVRHFDFCSGHRGSIDDRLLGAPNECEFRTDGLLPGRGHYLHFGNGGDAWKGFPSEAHRRDGSEVKIRLEFAGCMAFKGEWKVGSPDTLAVIRHADERDAPVLNVNGD